MKKWYEEVFENYAEGYDREPFTQGTAGEVKEFLAAGGQKSQENTFDLMTFRDHSKIEITDDSGRVKTLACDERYYTPSEMTWMLKSLGFQSIGVHGAKLGAFSRADHLTPEDFEILVIAEKEIQA